MFRKTLFWSHLVCGVLAGIVILMMSFTGLMLTYERQLLSWFEQRNYLSPVQEEQTLTLEQLHFIATTEHGHFSPTVIVVKNNPGAPVTFLAGQDSRFNLNPISGEEMEVGNESLDVFFSTITGIHRWFNLTGERRATARAITGASNLMFLFLIMSGFYLWFPKLWKPGLFKIRLAFRNTAGNSRARDFNWHHVLGIWSAIPLVIVVATATVFYYPWANNLVYQVYGEEIIVQSRGQRPTVIAIDIGENTESLPATAPTFLSLDELFNKTAEYIESPGESWRQISVAIPQDKSRTVTFAIDQGNGGQPHLRQTLILSRETGDIAALQPFSSQSLGSQTSSIIRYLHTGEVLGFWGQTIAGLVSLTSLFMVWTGIALAWRRLITPLYRNKFVAHS